MPAAVIDAVAAFGRADRANVHRGVHTLSERATAAYEAARAAVQRFINAREASEIVFVRGDHRGDQPGGAQLRARGASRAGDEVLVTAMEHHSNLVPWQMLCAERQARLRVVPVTAAGELRLDELDAALGPRTRILAVAHVANARSGARSQRGVQLIEAQLARRGDRHHPQWAWRSAPLAGDRLVVLPR